MERTFVLTHPEAPQSMNAGGGGSRRHWGAAHAEKKKWQGILLKLLLAERVPKGMTFCEATAVIRWKHRNRRDSTNYIAAIVKPLADVLAPHASSHAPRWLPDDTDEYFRFGGVSFEYPEEWPYHDPRVKSELVICLVASYAPRRARPAPARGGRDG